MPDGTNETAPKGECRSCVYWWSDPTQVAENGPASRAQTCAYWRGEAERAIKHRDAVLAVFRQSDCGAAMWRDLYQQAKMVFGQKTWVCKECSATISETPPLLRRLLKLEEHFKQIDQNHRDTKEALWHLMDTLEPESEVRQQIGLIWRAM